MLWVLPLEHTLSRSVGLSKYKQENKGKNNNIDSIDETHTATSGCNQIAIDLGWYVAYEVRNDVTYAKHLFFSLSENCILVHNHKD